MEDRSRTIKEWRELRGMDREELAAKSGVGAKLIARLEEVGNPTEDGTIEGDRFANAVVGPLIEALDVRGAGIRLSDAPTYPTPGAYVLDMAALEKLDRAAADCLAENAEAIGLRMAVPTPWGVALKRYADIEKADLEAVAAHKEREIAYGMAKLKQINDLRALLAEHAEYEGQILGEVFEERGGRMLPKPPKIEEGDE